MVTTFIAGLNLVAAVLIIYTLSKYYNNDCDEFYNSGETFGYEEGCEDFANAMIKLLESNKEITNIDIEVICEALKNEKWEKTN